MKKRILFAFTKIYPISNDWPAMVNHFFIDYLQDQINIEKHLFSEDISDSMNWFASIHCLKPKNPVSAFLNNFYRLYCYCKIVYHFWRIDIVHFWNYPWWKFFLLYIFCILFRTKIIVTVHDQVTKEMQYYWLFSKITHRFHRIVSRMLLNRSDMLVVFSEFMYQYASNVRGKQMITKTIIPQITFPVTYENKNKIIMFSYGSHRKKKNFNLLIEAFSKIIENGYKNVLLILWGKWPDTPALIDLCKQKNLLEYVQFPWFLSEEAIQNYYSHCDIIIHPADYEWYGIAILESLFSWKIVITSDVGWQAEFKSRFKNLHLFKSWNISSLSHLLTKVILSWNFKPIEIPSNTIEYYSFEKWKYEYIKILHSL